MTPLTHYLVTKHGYMVLVYMSAALVLLGCAYEWSHRKRP